MVSSVQLFEFASFRYGAGTFFYVSRLQLIQDLIHVQLKFTRVLSIETSNSFILLSLSSFQFSLQIHYEIYSEHFLKRAVVVIRT